jgi:hypothetical protein
MNITIVDILGIATAILGSLGGATLILFAFSNWLGKLWAGRLMEDEKAKHSRDLEALRNRFLQDTEKYKTALKKSEFIFQKEYEAASALVALAREIRPTYSHPDMDWHDACDDIALRFEEIEKAFESYLRKHGAVLTEQIRELIGKCIGLASDGAFHVDGPDNVSSEANQSANNLYDTLMTAEKLLLERVHAQSST